MKHLTRLLACGALLTALAWPALSQDNNSGATAATTAVAAQDDEACNALYTTFYEAQKAKEYAKTYDLGKEYLQKCQADNDYRKAVQKYVTTYEIQQRRKAMYDALKGSKYDEAFAVGKQVTVDYATDPQIFYDLTRAGGAAADLKNEKNNADAAAYAKQVITFAEAGKMPKGVTKDQMLGEANYTLGTVLEKPEEQVPALVKAAQSQVYGKDAGVYFKLALAYQEGEYTKNEAAYNALIADKSKTPDDPAVKDALKSYQQSADRLIDALARTIVFATTPELAKLKADCNALIAGLYKFRNKSDAGLQAFISGILGKPIPQPGQPIDYFPPPVAATTPPANGTATPAAGTGTMPANGTTTPANGAKPGVKPPTKPKGKAKPKGKKG